MNKLNKAILGLAAFSAAILGGFNIQFNHGKLAIHTQTAQANEHPYSTQLVIDYINYTYHQGDIPLQFTFPNAGFVNNDETEFNLITWTDERWPGGFSWVEFYGLGDTAYEWWKEYSFDSRWLEIMGDVDALTDSTVNGHELPGAVVVTKGDVGLGNVDNTADANKPISTATQTALDGKVDKVTGKGLSQEDFTTTIKGKVDLLPTAADLTTSLNGKLDVPTGTTSQVVLGNGTLGALPAAQVQADYGQSNSGAADFIKNKPNLGLKSDKSAFAGVSTLSAHGTSNGATDAATNAATDAPSDAPTNLNVVTTLLGALTGEVNATNGRQNQIATN